MLHPDSKFCVNYIAKDIINPITNNHSGSAVIRLTFSPTDEEDVVKEYLWMRKNLKHTYKK